jgi:superfamily I DNA/RNA helicase
MQPPTSFQAHTARVLKAVEDEERIGELKVSEYIIFLFALDTYMRYLEEIRSMQVNTDVDPSDQVLKQGLSLLRTADREHLAIVEREISTSVTVPASLSMLKAAVSLPPTARGAAIRTLKLRTILSRGGTATSKAIFGKSIKARGEVREAMDAAMLEDADAALAKLAMIDIRNTRLEKWIDLASETARPLPTADINPVQAATKVVADSTQTLLQAGLARDGSPAASEESSQQATLQNNTLRVIERDAQAAASKGLAKSGESDAPVTRSEAIAIATTVAAVQKADTTDLRNIPEAFINGKQRRPLDPEQMAAAMTDGRVLVAAGAGAGKSTTLVSRIAYLVQNRSVKPSKIFACSFNRKAANELKDRIGDKIGDNLRDQISLGTMNALFARFIVGDRGAGIPAFGTEEERALFTEERLIADAEEGKPFKRGPKPINMTKTIQGVFKSCQEALIARTGWPKEWFKDIPKAKKCTTFVSVWKGNDVSWEDARKGAKTKQQKIASLWYEFYLGLKGDIPGWRPPCAECPPADKWMDNFRPGKERLGDLDDQIRIFRDTLQRNPDARARVQSMYDHILVDEAQDRNLIKAQVFELMSEHITDGADGKSLWIVGDDKQAIYQFNGARPELFSKLYNKEGWKTRMIRTNYRCAPEIVDAANKLAAHNKDQIPMVAQANPEKQRGRASVSVEVPTDPSTGAISTIRRIVKETTAEPLGKGKPRSDFAVLTRTNKELNDYETACCLAEIPYARTGGKGLFDAPESRAVLGYIDLVYGTNFEKMAKSLADALTKPDRGLYMGADKAVKIVEETLGDIARGEGRSSAQVNPFELISKERYARELATALKTPFRTKMPAWKFPKVVDELTRQILSMGQQLSKVKLELAQNSEIPASDVIARLLDSISGTTATYDPDQRREIFTTRTLREQITEDLALFSDDDDEEEEAEEVAPEIGPEGSPIVPEKPKDNPAKGLGAVQFLYLLSEPNNSDIAEGTDPTKAAGFLKKLTRIQGNSEKLRVDLNKWAKAQKILPPDKREKRPDCVILSTVHSVKGAEWRDVTVVMPPGVFPMERKPAPGEDPPSEEEAEANLVAERNLGYVALTRAEERLSVLCPPSAKKRGLSMFVIEAGLSVGENVPTLEGAASPEDVKTASHEDSDLDIEYLNNLSELPPSTYER